MSSGNPFGLSEISHYGTMQRVGGKAAGFINKKFFHPSSFRNQEKLWKAQTAHAVEERKQADMEKRRDEERQVEELRKQMYLAGQAKATDMLSFTPGMDVSAGSRGRTAEQVKSIEEQKRRKAMLKQERASQEGTEAAEDDHGQASDAGAEGSRLNDGEPPADQGASGSGGSRVEASSLVPAAKLATLLKSRYTEDKHVRGHQSVWGSWFTTAAMKWGFRCCKSTDYALRCPLAPEEDPEAPKAKRPRGEPRGKKRRRGGNAEVVDGSSAVAAATPAATALAGSSGSTAGGSVRAVDGAGSDAAADKGLGTVGAAAGSAPADAGELAAGTGEGAEEGGAAGEGGAAVPSPAEGASAAARDAQS